MEPNYDLDFEHYTVAWIAPLEIEAQAAWYMLDHKHQGHFSINRGDDYVYTAGDINGHNVIIATFPAGHDYGVGSAAALASQVKKSFPNLWFGLLVGVAAGLPNLSRIPPRDIRLGDVLVGVGEGESAGLVSYGLGKETSEGFEPLRYGAQAKTETVVRSAIGSIKTYAPMRGNVFLKHYEGIKDEHHSNGTFADPGQERDQLCETVTEENKPVVKLVERTPRHASERTKVWYGPIGSGDKLMKNAQKRDELRDKFNLIGLEMEAAGTMNTIPVGVIRGVCDYGDAQKNKEWQPYAAAMAAAYTKALLYEIKPKKNQREEALQALAKLGTQKVSEEQKVSPNGGPQFLNPEVRGTSFVYQISSLSSPETIYDWISSIPYWAHHTAMCDDLLEGSGEWLLERNDFRQWEFSTSSTVLWLHGILGSGKSKLVACIIGHLQKSPEFLPGNFAFFYCVRGDSDKERSNPEEVIRSLLRQLAFHDDPFNSYNPFNASNSLKDPVAKLYKEKAAHSQKTRHEVEKFTKKECIDILTDLLKGGSTTIIIDAFDELDRSTRGLLFQVFDTINGELRKSKDGGIVRLLVSSRNDQDIVRKLANYHNIEIGVEDNKKDIERFVYVEVAKAISSGMLLSGNVSQDLQSEIESVLIKKSRGMFRWVSLQISWLCGSRSSRVARKRLNELSEGLEESYQRVYTQILALDQDDSAMARKAISWLLCGKRHLSTSEFITAVCLDTDTTPAKIRDLITKETLLDLCQNLVVLDKELDIFRVAHLSVREFFERKDGFGKHDVSAVALDVCIAALVNDAGLGTWDFTGSFKFYAQVYWPDHCEGLGPQGPPEPLRSKVKSFLLEGQVASSAFTKWTDDVKLRLPRLSDLQIRKIGDVSRLLEMPLYPVCACGMLWLAKDASLQHVNWSFQKANHDNGIIVAALWGHHSMVEFLLQRGVPVDSRGVENRTALHVAASHGRKKVAMILLERDADINARQEGSAKGVWPVSPPGATALHEAASNGHLELVECLLRSGANIEASNGRRETPLFGAVRKDLNVTRYLLDRGAQINVKAERDDTVLHAAAYAAAESHNLKEIVVLLLARSADISAVRDDGITPLHWAAKSEIILSVFLAKMAQSDLQRSWMGTSLIQAVQSHSLDSITLLLERGININSMETSGKRPLDYALELGSPQILSTLLAHKAKPGLAWNIASTYIQEGKNYPWFSGLVEIILRGDIPQLWLQRFPHILGAREEEKVVTQSSPDLPYLEVLIPHELDDVQGIIFYIESHDQGWSDDKEWHGTYIHSFTWFEADIKFLKPSTSVGHVRPSGSSRPRIQLNVHASNRWRTHRNIWDVRDLKRREWLMLLRPGDSVQVFAKARYNGWRNYIKSIKAEIYGSVAVE